MHPEKVTSPVSRAFIRNEGRVGAARYRLLDHRHVEAIWRARSSKTLWEGALTGVCSLRPDLKRHVEKMAEAHTGIEAIVLRYCAGDDNEVLFIALERLLASDDSELRDQPFEFFSLSNLDWRGRETLFVQSLIRDVPALRKSPLLASTSDRDDDARMTRGSIGLAMIRPVIALVEATPDDDEGWWNR